MRWWIRLYPKRMLWKRPRETRRGRLVLLQAAELTKIFTLWRRMFLAHPSHLQLDARPWSRRRTNLEEFLVLQNSVASFQGQHTPTQQRWTLLLQIRPNQQNQGSGTKPVNSVNKPMVQVHQGKLNFTTMSDIPKGASMLMGTFSINDTLLRYCLILERLIALLVGDWYKNWV
jgi:hypothetical protein